MKASFCLPSCDYNITLSEEELNQLLKTGHVMSLVSRIPCTTSRAIFNGSTEKMEFHDKKNIYNDLCFYTHERIADLEAGDYNVQFLHINIEKGRQGGNHGTKENQDGSD